MLGVHCTGVRYPLYRVIYFRTDTRYVISVMSISIKSGFWRWLNLRSPRIKASNDNCSSVSCYATVFSFESSQAHAALRPSNEQRSTSRSLMSSQHVRSHGAQWPSMNLPLQALVIYLGTRESWWRTEKENRNRRTLQLIYSSTTKNHRKSEVRRILYLNKSKSRLISRRRE